jgi:hypothetical protein
MLDLIDDMSCQSLASLGFETLGTFKYERGFGRAAVRQTRERRRDEAVHVALNIEGVYLGLEDGAYMCL